MDFIKSKKTAIICTLLFTLIILVLYFLGKDVSVRRKISETLKEPLSESTNINYIFTGDTGTGLSEQYDVAKSIKNFCDKNKCESSFIIGDVIYENGVSSVNDNQFSTKFEKPYENINLPFYIALGNHDVRGCVDCFVDYTKKSTKWRMPSSYYKIQSQDKKIDFFVINTENFDDKQAIWLKNELSASSANWKLVLGHRPIVTYEVAHANEIWPGRENLKNIICNNATAYISGHSHLLEDNGKIENCKVIQLVSGGGGAKPRMVSNDNHSTFYYAANGFVTTWVKDNSLVFDYIDVNSERVYRRVI